MIGYKVILLISTLLGTISPYLSAEEVRGWHIINTTTTPIAAAWYSREKQPLSNSEDTAIRSSEKLIIESGKSKFLAMHEQDSRRSSELAITQSPSLLQPTICLKKEHTHGITFYDKRTYRFLQKPFLEHLPATPKLYIGQAPGSTNLILMQSALPLERKGLFEKKWYLINKSPQALYAGWYISEWDATTRKYTNLKLGNDQHLFTISSEQKVAIPYPSESRGKKWYLCMSFDTSSLTKEISPDATHEPLHEASKVRTLLKADLGTFDTLWHIYDQKGLPYLLAHTSLLHVINTTNNLLYCAMYYIDGTGASKYGPSAYVTEILPQLSCELPYPPGQWWHTTKLLIAREDQKHLLSEQFLSKQHLEELYVKSFQKSSLVNWYIEGAFAIEPHRINPTHLHVSSIGGGFIERLARKAVDVGSFAGPLIKNFEEGFKRQDARYLPDPDIIAAKDTPSVLTEASQKIMEEEFVKIRSEKSRVAINKLFGKELVPQGSPIPKIALVFTGGGYRAMIETIGFMEGAASEAGGNIFDCCLYIGALSGSTWAVNGLVASGLTPQEFAKHQQYKVGEGGILSLRRLIGNLIEQSSSYPEQRFIEGRYTQFHGPIGLYGHALSHALLHGFSIDGRDSQTMRLSDLRKNLTQGEYPLPLSVAVDPGSRDTERVWYEFSPYYCGTYQEKGSWVDTKLLGCTFHKGRPVHIVPEYPLAHYMGIWGSAFALSHEDIQKESSVVGFITRSLLTVGTGFSKAYAFLLAEAQQQDPLSSRRFTAGTMPNYNYQRPDALEGVAVKPLLHFIDAGITMEGKERQNFATIPALWRDADLLIMCDCNGLPNSDTEAEHLLAADEEARRQRVPFPNLTRSTLHKATVKNMGKSVATLFKEDRAPLVIYMKAKKNTVYNGYLVGTNGPFADGFDPDVTISPFTKTTNFSYTPEQYEVLRGLTKSIFQQSKALIKEAIEEALNRSQGKGVTTETTFQKTAQNLV